MGVTVAELEAVVGVNSAPFTAGMAKVDAKMAESEAASKSHMGGIGGAAKMAAGVGGVLALVEGGKALFERMNMGQQTMAQTEAVLKSTGGAAHITAAGVDELAVKIQNHTGVSRDNVQASENMLLTFRGVANQAGAGNDIFNRTVMATQDMARAMGMDGTKAALQLGKAMNDPAAGMSRLQRVGVTFTQGQKDAAAAMEKSGNIAGAQKIILAELTKEFGGSANAAGKTFAGSMGIMKNELLDTGTAILKAVMPALTTFVQGVTKVTVEMGKHKTITELVIGALASLGVVLLAIKVATVLQAAASGIATAASAAWTAGQWLLNAALSANPIGLVILALVALGVGLKLAWDHSATFRNIVLGVWKDIEGVVTSTMHFITKTIPAGFETVVTWVRANWPVIAMVISGPFAPLVALATNAFGIRSALTGAFNSIVDAVSGAVGDVTGFMKSLPGKILAALGDLSGLLVHAGAAIIGGLISGLTSRLGEVAHLASSIAGKIASLKGPLEYDRQLLIPHGQAIMGGLLEGMTGGLVPVLAHASGVAGAISGAVGGGSGGVSVTSRALPGGSGASSGTVVLTGNSFLTGERETQRALFNLLAPFIGTGQIKVPAS